MNSNLLGNPHSQASASILSTLRIEAVRARVLEFFKADPEHFDLVFVANATAAIKLVMDGMGGRMYDQEGRGSFWYGYHADSHTSLVGVRECAAAGSKCFDSDDEVEIWLSTAGQESPWPTKSVDRLGLFAYPAQSNMNGRRLPLSWPGRIRSSNLPQHRHVYSLLDAAAFASTAQLDLSDFQNAPDFTALSFYKIFGFPDLGALLVRKEAGPVLRRRTYFGGGTVDMVINGVDDPDEAWYARKESSIHDAFEDGTPAFHNILALDTALDVHRRLYKSMAHVSRHTNYLAKVLYISLSALSHWNGLPVCVIYLGADSEYGNCKTQGPTIAFNLRSYNGKWINKSHVEQLAIANNLQLRTGGVCNPGGISKFLNLSPREMRDAFTEGLRCGSGVDELHGKPTGIIRASLGAMSTLEDVGRLVEFIGLFVHKANQSVEKPAMEVCKNANNTPLALTESKTSVQPRIFNAASLMESFTCPVASCRRVLRPNSDLSRHFSTHTVNSLFRRNSGRAAALKKHIERFKYVLLRTNGHTKNDDTKNNGGHSWKMTTSPTVARKGASYQLSCCPERRPNGARDVTE